MMKLCVNYCALSCTSTILKCMKQETRRQRLLEILAEEEAADIATSGSASASREEAP